jgi:hypothetical protein
LPIQSERGYLIPAVNTDTVDYIACARQLAQSIKSWHPTAQICLLTDQDYSDSVFDFVKKLPYGDLSNNATWKLSNDWQCFAASPFRQTIKLEADMIVASPVDHWWALFEKRDVVISQGCRDFYDNRSDCRFYRKLFDANQLPDVYNAMTYWRVSALAQQFFQYVRDIFENWDCYKTLLKFPDQEPTTDVVYAIAAVIVGDDLCTLPSNIGPSIVHMKRHIIPTLTSDWTQELIWENINPGLRINTVAQWGLVHYHHKHWRIDDRHN